MGTREPMSSVTDVHCFSEDREVSRCKMESGPGKASLDTKDLKEEKEADKSGFWSKSSLPLMGSYSTKPGGTPVLETSRQTG